MGFIFAFREDLKGKRFDKFEQLGSPSCTVLKPISKDISGLVDWHDSWCLGLLIQSEVFIPRGWLYGPNGGIYKTFGLGDGSLPQLDT
jgi:hypothetical protein